MKPKTKQEQERTTSAMCDNVAQRVQRQKLTNHVTQIAHTVVKPTSVYKPPHTHTNERTAEAVARHVEKLKAPFASGFRFVSCRKCRIRQDCTNLSVALRKPLPLVARTFASGCANLRLRLCRSVPPTGSRNLRLRLRKPLPQFAQTFASGCANLRLRLRKPSPQVAQTFTSGCAKLCLRKLGECVAR